MDYRDYNPLDCDEAVYNFLSDLLGDVARRQLMRRMIERQESHPILRDEGIVKAFAEWKRAQEIANEKREAAIDAIEKALAHGVKLLS